MQFKLKFYLSRWSQNLSVRASFFAVMAISAALMAAAFGGYVPDDFVELVGGSAVDQILTIIASSMLVVVTFSLSVMVAAYATASGSATPRATTLMMQDAHGQNALSIFLGAFIYSIVALVALGTGYYGPSGRAILFVTTIIVLLLVVWTIIRWIDQLSRLGRVVETINRIEVAATQALCQRTKAPTLGCRLLPSNEPNNLPAVYSEHVGFVQTIDLDDLANIAARLKTDIYILADAGTFVHLKTPLVRLNANLSEAVSKQIRDVFITGQVRTFENDPRYGMTVLSEVASRALSPAINDPGTAVDVITALVRTIAISQQEKAECMRVGATDLKYPRLYAPTLSIAGMFDDAFDPIARAGAGLIEVATKLREALAALTALGDPEITAAAKVHRQRSLARCEIAMVNADDLTRIRST